MKTEEELKTTSLVGILDEIHNVSILQDNIMQLVRNTKDMEARIKLLREYDVAENYYKALNREIYNRWGFDTETPLKESKNENHRAFK